MTFSDDALREFMHELATVGTVPHTARHFAGQYETAVDAGADAEHAFRQFAENVARGAGAGSVDAPAEVREAFGFFAGWSLSLDELLARLADGAGVPHEIATAANRCRAAVVLS